jgi:micrococcal nuclease
MADSLYQYTVTVNRVIDGDTLEVDIDLGFNVTLTGKRLRVAGVDCPERNTPEGKLAKFFTKEWVNSAIHSNKPVLVKIEAHKGDKYGRILGGVWVDGKDLAQQLILNNHGVPYDGSKKGVSGTLVVPPQGE